MLEVHGVADVMMGSDQVDVVVREQKNAVALAFQEQSFRSRQVLLTAEQARKIAEHLIEAANRLDAREATKADVKAGMTLVARDAE